MQTASVILTLYLVAHIYAAPINQQGEQIDYSLIDVNDEDLEQEIRKRHIGGPWSPEDAMSMLNQAADLLTGSIKTDRSRKFYTEAQHLLQLLTGDEHVRHA